MRMQKLLFSMLAAALTLSLLTACSAQNGSHSEGTAASGTAAASVTTDRYVADDLPSTLDYGGKTVNWLIGDYFNAFWEDFYAENETGSTINDDVYAARRSVDERLNVKINMTQFTYSSSETAKYKSLVTNLILSGDQTYSVIAGLPDYSLIVEGDYFIKLNDNKFIDFEKPWWNDSVTNLLPSGVVYYAPGDGSLSLIKHTFCFYVNLDSLSGSGYKGDIYDLVFSGGWTIDSLRDIIKSAYSDLNGDQKADPSDSYGLAFGDFNKYFGFVKSCGVNCFVKNSDDTYTMTSGSDTAARTVAACCALINEDKNVLKGTANSDAAAVATGYAVSSGGGNYASKAFMEGRAIFAAQLVGDAATLFKDTSFKYGLLPYPKLDDKQSDYISSPQRYAAFSIPATCPDSDLAGAILEAWASVCYRTLQPDYFETTLKVRYSQDDKMSKVFDLLRSNFVLEFGDIFSSYFKMTPAYEFKNAMVNNNPNWASVYASYESADTASLEKLMAALQK